MAENNSSFFLFCFRPSRDIYSLQQSWRRRLLRTARQAARRSSAFRQIFKREDLKKKRLKRAK